MKLIEITGVDERVGAPCCVMGLNKDICTSYIQKPNYGNTFTRINLGRYKSG